jgi:hypothetical protein
LIIAAGWNFSIQLITAASLVQLRNDSRMGAGAWLFGATIVRCEATGFASRYDSGGMKNCIYLLMALALFAACEQKTTTVNPPAEKKESNTTVVNPPAEKKESNTTVINSSPATTTKEEKTDININTSPSP